MTFNEVECAYEVIDKFAKDPLISKYDIRFGGRRKFCKQNYADLGKFLKQIIFNGFKNLIYFSDSLAEEKLKAQKSKDLSKPLSFEDLLNLAKKKLSDKK